LPLPELHCLPSLRIRLNTRCERDRGKNRDAPSDKQSLFPRSPTNLFLATRELRSASHPGVQSGGGHVIVIRLNFSSSYGSTPPSPHLVIKCGICEIYPFLTRPNRRRPQKLCLFQPEILGDFRHKFFRLRSDVQIIRVILRTPETA